MLSELFEFVSLPERKTFSEKQLARCLSKFAHFYHLLVQNSKSVSKEGVRELRNMIDDVEEACYIGLADIKPNLDKAFIDIMFRGKPEEARREIMSALARLKDEIGLIAGYITPYGEEEEWWTKPVWKK